MISHFIQVFNHCLSCFLFIHLLAHFPNIFWGSMKTIFWDDSLRTILEAIRMDHLHFCCLNWVQALLQFKRFFFSCFFKSLLLLLWSINLKNLYPVQLTWMKNAKKIDSNYFKIHVEPVFSFLFSVSNTWIEKHNSKHLTKNQNTEETHHPNIQLRQLSS